MDENNKVSVKINKIWIFIGVLVVITIVANVYVITNNKTQTSEDKNFETEEQANAVSTRVENTQNIDSLSEVDAEKILKDKYAKIEKVMFSADTYFELAKEDENGMRRILNFEEALSEDFTENMINNFKANLPMGVREENDSYYYVDWGGDFPYGGLDKFENLETSSSKITADAIIKMVDYEDNLLPSKKCKIVVIKNDGKWLVDNFDIKYIFIDYDEDGIESQQDFGTKTSELSNEEALTLGKQKYDEVQKLAPQYDSTEGVELKVTNISEIKSKLTDSAFKYFCEEYNIIEKNGQYYHPVGDIGTDPSYESSKVENVDSIKENEIEYTVVANYNEYNQYDEKGEEIKEKAHSKEYKFVLEKENDTWKVSQYTLLY